MSEKKHTFFQNIRKECFDLISLKKVDVQELSFLLGIKEEEFYQNFSSYINDLTFYLKTYNLLVEWSE